MNQPNLRRLRREQPPVLTFAALAWLKLQFFCHSGQTEIGGFGVSAAEDLLYIEDFVTVRQQVSEVSVRFDDAAVADWFDRCVDRGIPPGRCGRIWLHTHPGASVTPSSTDEDTFEHVFGRCDWSVMFILGRTGNTYARLAFSAGPGGSLLLPVQVDWSSWPQALSESVAMEKYQEWQQEYETNVHPLPDRFALLNSVHEDRHWEEDPIWDVRLGLPLHSPELLAITFLDEDNHDHENDFEPHFTRPRSAAARDHFARQTG